MKIALYSYLRFRPFHIAYTKLPMGMQTLVTRYVEGYFEREGAGMTGNLDKFAGIGQALLPLLSALGKIQGEGEALKQMMAFVDDHAEQILQARPLLESEGLVQLVDEFIPGAKGHDLKQAVELLLDMAEKSAKKRR